jgi:hypothetical protein
MIARVFPEAYDAHGKKVLQPHSRRKGWYSTAPMGRYVSQPLTVKCDCILDIQRFLSGCEYVSDEKQFGKKDYWQAPEEFERTKKGDCDCFALWTWREFLALGFDARFVTGRSGRYGEGHAWVQFSRDGRDFLIEPMMARVGYSMPRLSTLQYRPRYSVAWDGTKLSFYSHEDRRREPPFVKVLASVPDWLIFWAFFWVMWSLAWIRLLVLSPFTFYRRARSIFSS